MIVDHTRPDKDTKAQCRPTGANTIPPTANIKHGGSSCSQTCEWTPYYRSDQWQPPRSVHWPLPPHASSESVPKRPSFGIQRALH
eukprot:1263129-Amphidinium_carterae.1